MKDAFNPEEETERDWDLELAEDVKSECEDKYGKVVTIFVVKESQVSFSLALSSVDSALSRVLTLFRSKTGRDLYSFRKSRGCR